MFIFLEGNKQFSVFFFVVCMLCDYCFESDESKS